MGRTLVAALLVAVLVAAAGAGHREAASPQETRPLPETLSSPEPQSPPEMQPAPETEPTPETQPPPEMQPAPETEPAPESQPPPEIAPPVSPPPTPMSWDAAGAFVWHETDVSPEALGQELREAGFGWIAVFLHDGLEEDPVEDDWVNRFRRASGLHVGGWGALRAQPVEEAALATTLVSRYGLDFYIANAEAEYAYSGPDGQSPERYDRSRAFVATFRRLRPDLPAGLSSYCRADRKDIDWKTWSGASFTFLPQAYVNDFGREAAPATCANAARGFFARSSVHPTIGMYPGVASSPAAVRYVRLLQKARTTGFSVYLAETRMTQGDWQALGEAIVTRSIASHVTAS